MNLPASLQPAPSECLTAIPSVPAAWRARQERFLREPRARRLGELAANLARMASFSTNPAHGPAVERLAEECKYFIEWIAPELGLAEQCELLKLQRLLACWQLHWQALWQDAEKRAALAAQTEEWAQMVLALSGLLPQSPA
jgi:hypothetical protein